MELTVRMPVIGVVRSSRQELENTPIQAGLNRAEHGTIEIAEPYRDGLDGLAGFDYAWLLSWLDRPRDPAGDPALRQVPFLLRRQQTAMGIFATRGPRCGWFDQLTISDGTTPGILAQPEPPP